MNADAIAVVDGGRVVERGTHHELMELNGLYAGMVRAQTVRGSADAPEAGDVNLDLLAADADAAPLDDDVAAPSRAATATPAVPRADATDSLQPKDDVVAEVAKADADAPPPAPPPVARHVVRRMYRSVGMPTPGRARGLGPRTRLT